MNPKTSLVKKALGHNNITLTLTLTSTDMGLTSKIA